MTIIERVKSLDFPLDELVVIGSGLLDALGLRMAHDIDLAVSPRLFAELKAEGNYTWSVTRGEEVLEGEGIEIWQSWGMDDGLQYDALKKSGVMIDGVRFCHPSIVIEHKRIRASKKDQTDIQLLEAYVATHSGVF